MKMNQFDSDFNFENSLEYYIILNAQNKFSSLTLNTNNEQIINKVL